jgi:thymidylate kinase
MKSSRIVMAAIASAAQGTKRGAFIVFEGIDRCGKSTQVDLLGKALDNAKNIRFPDRTSAIGQMINSYLVSATNMNDQAIHLLFSANRWEAVEVSNYAKILCTFPRYNFLPFLH